MEIQIQVQAIGHRFSRWLLYIALFSLVQLLYANPVPAILGSVNNSDVLKSSKSLIFPQARIVDLSIVLRRAVVARQDQQHRSQGQRYGLALLLFGGIVLGVLIICGFIACCIAIRIEERKTRDGSSVRLWPSTLGLQNNLQAHRTETPQNHSQIQQLHRVSSSNMTANSNSTLVSAPSISSPRNQISRTRMQGFNSPPPPYQASPSFTPIMSSRPGADNNRMQAIQSIPPQYKIGPRNQYMPVQPNRSLQYDHPGMAHTLRQNREHVRNLRIRFQEHSNRGRS